MNGQAPPFGQNSHQEVREIIDLSSTDAEEDNGSGRNRTRAVSLASSPEIQIVGERHVARRPNLPSFADLVGEPPGLRRADAQTFRNTTFAGTIQQMATNIIGGFASGNAPPADFGRFIPMPGHLRNFREYFRRSVDIPTPLEADLYDDDDDFGSVYLDYEAGGLEIIDPGDHGGAAAGSDYKPPPAPREGFTRNIEEDDTDGVLVCVGCEEELTATDEDVKQQVWVLKKCGHVSFSVILDICSLLTNPRSIVVNVLRSVSLLEVETAAIARKPNNQDWMLSSIAEQKDATRR